MSRQPFRVERESFGCEHCKRGQRWWVIYPDGAAGGTSYERREDAEEVADEMNYAYRLGFAAGRKLAKAKKRRAKR